eukprot:6048253-Prymnesium_polylepis.1
MSRAGAAAGAVGQQALPQGGPGAARRAHCAARPAGAGGGAGRRGAADDRTDGSEGGTRAAREGA